MKYKVYKSNEACPKEWLEVDFPGTLASKAVEIAKQFALDRYKSCVMRSECCCPCHTDDDECVSTHQISVMFVEMLFNVSVEIDLKPTAKAYISEEWRRT